MLVYLNHAPEHTTISAKLVGFSLVTVFPILGVASIWIIINSPSTQVHSAVFTFIILVLMSSLLIVSFFRSTLHDTRRTRYDLAGAE
jgi:cytochrome c biogenesis protein CcdA